MLLSKSQFTIRKRRKRYTWSSNSSKVDLLTLPCKCACNSWNEITPEQEIYLAFIISWKHHTHNLWYGLKEIRHIDSSSSSFKGQNSFDSTKILSNKNAFFLFTFVFRFPFPNCLMQKLLFFLLGLFVVIQAQSSLPENDPRKEVEDAFREFSTKIHSAILHHIKSLCNIEQLCPSELKNVELKVSFLSSVFLFSLFPFSSFSLLCLLSLFPFPFPSFHYIFPFPHSRMTFPQNRFVL